MATLVKHECSLTMTDHCRNLRGDSPRDSRCHRARSGRYGAQPRSNQRQRQNRRPCGRRIFWAQQTVRHHCCRENFVHNAFVCTENRYTAFLQRELCARRLFCTENRYTAFCRENFVHTPFLHRKPLHSVFAEKTLCTTPFVHRKPLHTIFAKKTL